MKLTELYETLQAASSSLEAESIVHEFEVQNKSQWLPVGRENNRGTIEVAADPVRSMVERLTNGMDALLEMEFERHGGLPVCRSPKEAAVAWLGVPESGLSGMTAGERRSLGQRVSIRIQEGEGRESRIVEVIDRGVGIDPVDMDKTILSLNEGNKLQKYYLAGTYGQGGSSTFAFSRLTFIASRHGVGAVGFTVVKFLDLPADIYKSGHYVYLADESGKVLALDLPVGDFTQGTTVKHFGYDLGGYPSPLGPNSVYGSLNTILFDPVMPVWLDDGVHKYRRIIKGSRNALNGASDEGDSAGPKLSHSMPTFYVSLGDFGQVGIEYWVLEQSKENKRPSAAFVNPSKPIVLTLNGQNQGEFSQSLIRKDAELSFLSQRLICHIDCNRLSPTAKRQLFVSNREAQRQVRVRDLIQDEIVRALRSDELLHKLNDEARQQGRQAQDESAIRQMRTEVARLLRLQGVEVGQGSGGKTGKGEPLPPTRTHPPRPKPEPVEIHEPPTYIRFVWDEEEAVKFYPEQRRYLRIVTDANSTYHNPNAPSASRLNIVVGSDLVLRGSTPLQGGRMRAVVESLPTAQTGGKGVLRLELTRLGLPALVDERAYATVPPPPSKPADSKLTLPPFNTIPIDPSDPKWASLGWADDPKVTASMAEMGEGVLTIYYSTVFPKFENQRRAFEAKDADLARSFVKRYEIWLAVHSLLLYQDQTVRENHSEGPTENSQEDPEVWQNHERQERCRIGILSTLFASREVLTESAESVTLPE